MQFLTFPVIRDISYSVNTRRNILIPLVLASLLLGAVGGCLLRAENALASKGILTTADMATMETTAGGCTNFELAPADCVAPMHSVHHANTPAILVNEFLGAWFIFLVCVFFVARARRTDLRTTLESKFRLILKRRKEDFLHWFDLPSLLFCFRKGILHPKLHTA